MDNEKAIMLLSVIYKVLESVILGLGDNVLDTDNLQFDFKCGIGCSDAIFSLKSVTNHFLLETVSYLLLHAM